MARLCTVCTHPERQEIDLALMLHRERYRAIASRWGVTKPSLQRHERAHLAMSWEKSKELGAMLSAENLLEKLGKWHERMEDQYTKADAADEIMATVATARTGIAAIESFSRVGILSDVERRLAALENPPDEDSEDSDE